MGLSIFWYLANKPNKPKYLFLAYLSSLVWSLWIRPWAYPCSTWVGSSLPSKYCIILERLDSDKKLELIWPFVSYAEINYQSNPWVTNVTTTGICSASTATCLKQAGLLVYLNVTVKYSTSTATCLKQGSLQVYIKSYSCKSYSHIQRKHHYKYKTI